MNKKVTLDQLKKLDACSLALTKFYSLFGDEVILTEKLVLKHYNEFDINWCIRNLLSKSYAVKYDKIVVPALKQYHETFVAIMDNHEKDRDISSKQYRKALDAAMEEYKKSMALNFYRLYKGI